MLTFFSDALVTILMIFVIVGIIPIIAMAYQFLVIPLHAFKNHYNKCVPYFPNVAIIIPAWNEAAVIEKTIERLIKLEYPPEALKIYVVDDASTDETETIMQKKVSQYPNQVFHLRREKGGEGKAHTLNHGLKIILSQPWMQALLITDADVIYSPNSLRKMTRHLADKNVGAVTAYIAEGTHKKNYMNRFVGMEYALSQAASRRGQNVLGALACLAGGAQLHSRENLETLGGQVYTESLAEDTITTFETQLQGKKVVFEPHAVVLAEEPNTVNSLWKQRLRWARGNVQLTKKYKHIWFRPSRKHNLGTISFALFWFSVFLLPVAMVLATIGLVGLFLLDSPFAHHFFHIVWALAAATYIYTVLLALCLDKNTRKHSVREAIFFPGIISTIIIITTFFPGVFSETVYKVTSWTIPNIDYTVWTLFVYSWMTLAMLAAWGVKKVEQTKFGKFFTPLLVYLIGYGPILCAVTVDSYFKEYKKVASVWEKTEKTGKVL